MKKTILLTSFISILVSCLSEKDNKISEVEFCLFRTNTNYFAHRNSIFDYYFDN